MDAAKPPKQWGAGRVAFLALRDVVAKAIDEGHPLTAIYRRHAEQIPVSYAQFQKYVARHITGTVGTRGGRVSGRIQPASAAPAPNAAQAAEPPQEPAAQGRPNSDHAPFGSMEWRKRHGIPEPDREYRPAFVVREPDLESLVFGRKRDETKE